MISKKDLPLNLLKTIEAVAQPNLDIIQFKREENTYYCFIETDINSKNYFKIFIDGSNILSNYDRGKYTIDFKPTDVTSATHGISQNNLQEVETTFRAWVNLIREIHETPSVHDDNFIKHYSDFYFKELKVVDEDANISPFNPEQQDLIDLYLDSLKSAIKNSDEVISGEIKSELASEIQIIKQTLPITTKNEVMKRVTKIFGKLYKVSKELAKEIVLEAKKNLIKKLIELGIEYGPKILEMFTKHHFS